MIVFYETDKPNVWVAFDDGRHIGNVLCREIGGNIGFMALLFDHDNHPELDRVGSFTDTAWRAVESAKDPTRSEIANDETKKLFFIRDLRLPEYLKNLQKPQEAR